MQTVVYVDGFNLYYGCLKGTGHRWLDVNRMCQLLLPQHEIATIKYFTAKVSGRPGKPDLPNRQELYFRALRTLPNIEIILGHFLETTARMVLASSPLDQPRFAQVRKMEEKGSDVNLAVHLVHDGHRGKYDVAILVTNDSDLIEAVRIVRSDLGLPVGILCPYRRPSVGLSHHATFVKPIRTGVLASSQFPATLHDAKGQFTKPARW
jgi:hypothetical protein